MVIGQRAAFWLQAQISLPILLMNAEGAIPVNFLKAVVKVFRLLNPHSSDIPFMLRFTVFPALINSIA